MNSTTRRYPRTSAEAFKGHDYGAAIEKPAPRDRAVNWALAVAVVVIVLSICFQGAPK